MVGGGYVKYYSSGNSHLRSNHVLLKSFCLHSTNLISARGKLYYVALYLADICSIKLSSYFLEKHYRFEGPCLEFALKLNKLNTTSQNEVRFGFKDEVSQECLNWTE